MIYDHESYIQHGHHSAPREPSNWIWGMPRYQIITVLFESPLHQTNSLKLLQISKERNGDVNYSVVSLWWSFRNWRLLVVRHRHRALARCVKHFQCCPWMVQFLTRVQQTEDKLKIHVISHFFGKKNVLCTNLLLKPTWQLMSHCQLEGHNCKLSFKKCKSLQQFACHAKFKSQVSDQTVIFTHSLLWHEYPPRTNTA